MSLTPSDHLPMPGEAAFTSLSATDQAWLEGFYPWYRRATTRVSPRLALTDPRTASFGPSDLQQFVKFYGCNAPVFDMLLAHLLGDEGQGASAEARLAFWKKRVEQRARRAT